MAVYRVVHPAIDMYRRINSFRTGRFDENKSIMRGLTTPVQRSNSKIRDILTSLTRPLTITNYCRLFDIVGSSNDLPQWQNIFNHFSKETDYKNLYGEWGKGFPTLSACCSNIPVEIEFEAAKDPNTIVYSSPDHNIKDSVWDFSVNPRVPIGSMAKAAFFILGNVYGLRGIKVSTKPSGAVAKSGGLESSNAFVYSLHWAGTTLAGTGHGPGELFSRSVNDSNYAFNDLTGGQGISASIEGGYHTFKYIVGPGMLGYISHETIPPSAYGEIESHIDLVQPGKNFSLHTKRSAKDVNKVWCERNTDVEGFNLNSEIPQLGTRFAEMLRDAAVNKDEKAWEESVKIANRQAVGIRAKLCPEYFSGNEAFVEEVIKMGGAPFALGAGGPETMFAILGPSGLTRAVRNKFGLEPITEDIAKDVLASNGILQGYVPYKINEKGMTYSEDWSKFGPIPPHPLAIKI